MNELEFEENDIKTQHFETNEQNMMSVDRVGNDTGHSGDSDGEGNEMLLLDCNKNKSFEEILEHDLIEASVNAYNEGVIPGVPKNWQQHQSPSNFKSYKPIFGAPS